VLGRLYITPLNSLSQELRSDGTQLKADSGPQKIDFYGDRVFLLSYTHMSAVVTSSGLFLWGKRKGGIGLEKIILWGGVSHFSEKAGFFTRMRERFTSLKSGTISWKSLNYLSLS